MPEERDLGKTDLFQETDNQALISQTITLGPGGGGVSLFKPRGLLKTQKALMLVLAPPQAPYNNIPLQVGGPIGTQWTPAAIKRGDTNGRVLATPFLGLFVAVTYGHQQASSNVEIDFGVGGQYNIGGADIEVYAFNQTDLYYTDNEANPGYMVQLSAFLTVGVSDAKPHRTLPGTLDGTLITGVNVLPPGHASDIIVRPPKGASVIPQILGDSGPISYTLSGSDNNVYDADYNPLFAYVLNSSAPERPIELSDDVATLAVTNNDPTNNIVSIRLKFKLEL